MLWSVGRATHSEYIDREKSNVFFMLTVANR